MISSWLSVPPTLPAISPRPALRPLLKWAGGKRSEIPFLRTAYPKGARRVVEPFAGGAAVAFDWNASQSLLNDVSEGLVRFYKTMQDPPARKAMIRCIRRLDDARKLIGHSVQSLTLPQLGKVFAAPGAWIEENSTAWLSGFPERLKKALLSDLLAQARDKTGKRIPALEKKHDKVFSASERRAHLETSLQAGIYTAMRRVYNGQVAHMVPEWEVAAWWFVRSLCYSGMFRYGKNGNFNVPYGGIGYNSRDFTSSIKQLSSPEMTDFFARAQICSMDFAALFETNSYFGPSDFIFVDPPYDSAFSKYNAKESFAEEDQRRLAQVLAHTQAPWMLVIKNTPFILSLYQGRGLYRGVFGKTYQANFRNRHSREVEHLVVANYPLPYVAEGEIGIVKEP